MLDWHEALPFAAPRFAHLTLTIVCVGAEIMEIKQTDSAQMTHKTVPAVFIGDKVFGRVHQNRTTFPNPLEPGFRCGVPQFSLQCFESIFRRQALPPSRHLPSAVADQDADLHLDRGVGPGAFVLQHIATRRGSKGGTPCAARADGCMGRRLPVRLDSRLVLQRGVATREHGAVRVATPCCNANRASAHAP